MDEYNIELPEMTMPIKFKTLKDHTHICTCRLPGINKYALVLDTGVETVLYFHFERKREIIKALFINAQDKDEYLDKLFELYPNLKAWLPTIPYGEAGDLCNIRLMNGEEYYSDSIIWIRNNDYSYSLKIFKDENIIIPVEQIRFIHVEVTTDTYTTIEMLEECGQEEDAKACTLMLHMALIHTTNYLKRRQEKEIKQQNEGDIYTSKK